MSDTQDDPLLGLLTDIAEGVARLATRVDAMETDAAAHRSQVNEALAIIAEIATRTYYAAKPSSALHDDIINASVMDAMIERWPRGAIIGWSRTDQALLDGLDKLGTKQIDALIAQANANPNQSNASRLRREASLALLNGELARRGKVRQQNPEREAPERKR